MDEKEISFTIVSRIKQLDMRMQNCWTFTVLLWRGLTQKIETQTRMAFLDRGTHGAFKMRFNKILIIWPSEKKVQFLIQALEDPSGVTVGGVCSTL